MPGTSSLVALAPMTAARNVIQPGAGNASALTLKAHASQSVDIHTIKNSAGTAYGGWNKDGELYTATPAANTMLAGGAPLHVNPAGSPGVKVLKSGDVLFGTNELIKNGSQASSQWNYGIAVFDGLYSALNKRWYMRSLLITELGDPPDLTLGRFGPNNTYPVNSGNADDLTGVPADTSVGKLGFRAGITPGGGTPDVTGGSSLSSRIAAVYARTAEITTSTAQGGYLVFQTTAIGTVGERDVARFHANGRLQLGANFDTDIYSSGVAQLATSSSLVVGGLNGLNLNASTTGTLLTVGGVANANRWLKTTGDGKVTIRGDDSSIQRSITLQNGGINGVDQGVSVAAQFATGNGTPADAGSIRFASEADWSSGANQDSYISLRTAVDGTVAERARLTSGGNLRLAGSLGVGNSAAASTPGTVVKKMQVFDASGSSLGYVAIYDAIT